MRLQLTIEQVAWRSAEALRLDIQNQDSLHHSKEAGNPAPAAVTYLRATIEAEAKEQDLLAIALAELRRAPADERTFGAFTNAWMRCCGRTTT